MKALDLLNDIVVFDMDGVLNKYDFTDLGFKMQSEKEWVKLNMVMNPYEFAAKTSLFDELIEKKNSMDIYALSVATSNFEQNNKMSFLEENYPNFREDNILFVSDKAYKVEVLKYLRELYDNSSKRDKTIVMIEDNVETLSDIISLNNDKIKCYLVSDFI